MALSASIAPRNDTTISNNMFISIDAIGRKVKIVTDSRIGSGELEISLLLGADIRINISEMQLDYLRKQLAEMDAAAKPSAAPKECDHPLQFVKQCGPMLGCEKCGELVEYNALTGEVKTSDVKEY